MRKAILLPLLACSASMASFLGMATHFDGVGYPYGACGVSDSLAWAEASQDTASGQGNPFWYVALNVFDTPGNYGSPSTFGNRPLVGADTVYLGLYHNGQNCGRWIKVRLGDFCNGNNDGAAGQPFCRGGTGWAPDSLNGASLDVVVFDQCTDGNAWCRDSKYHLDLHTVDLAHFRLDGTTVALATPNGSGPLTTSSSFQVSDRFGNREVLWDFEPAPNYQGEPRFYFSKDSKPYYMRLVVTHLPNGIHGLEQWTQGQWKAATMQGDAGQQWVLPDPSVTTFKVRLTDASDQLVMLGRTWTLDFPVSCGASCSATETLADNVVGEGGSLSIRAMAPAEPLAVHREGSRFVFRGRDGTVDLRDATGTLLGRVELVGGSATWTATRPGLVFARPRGTSPSSATSLVSP